MWTASAWNARPTTAFWFSHDAQKGKSIRVWYRPGRPLLERHNPGTELLAAFMALAGVALLLIR